MLNELENAGTPNPFPSGKGDRIVGRASPHTLLIPGAGVTPAEGSVKPIAGFHIK
jgi:hypothetical protein